MRKSNSAIRVLLTMHIPNTLSLGKKQSQEKIPIAFLFSQLHFNNVTSDSLFMAAILLGAVSDAQCKTSESP